MGQKCDYCPELFAQGEIMKNHEKQKYLGDIIHSNGKQRATIVERLSEECGIIANIRALLDDILLGYRRTQTGLELRQAWLINGVLYNSEIWQKLTEKDIRDLNKIDTILLRTIVGAHAKAPTEQLYLETSSLTLSQIISSQRMIYLQTTIQRTEGELVRRVYEEMKADPVSNDWCELVANVFNEVGLSLSDDQIRQMSRVDYKTLVKGKIRDSAFIHFKEMQAGHKKGKLIEHHNLLKPQLYLTTNLLTNKQVSLLYNLRCQSVWGIKNNFHRQYQDIQCPLCKTEIDSQSHVLLCTVIKKHYRYTQSADIHYNMIYGSLEKQVATTILYSSLLEVRNRLLEGTGLPGHHSTGLLNIIV